MLTPHPTLRRTDLFPQRGNDLNILGDRSSLHLTYNARGALYQLLRALPEKQSSVLLPGFHCTALVEPVAHSRFRTIFYRIKPDLSIDFDDLQSKVTRDAVVVVIHFFGFPTDLSPLLEMRKQTGFYLLEDCAHSFLTVEGGRHIGHGGDFSIYSFYKTVPSLFGGGLRTNDTPYGKQVRFVPSQSSVSLKESMVISKRLAEQLVENSKDGFFKRGLQRLENYRVSRKHTATVANESSSPGFVDDPYLFREDLALAKMPAASKRILKSCDWRGIIEARRRNYELLSATLQETALLQKLFPILPEGICPWAYPVLLQDRVRYEQQLRARGVPLFTFGEVLHPLLANADAPTQEAAEYLSHHLLMLPVHQNLSVEDVLRYATEINLFLTDIVNCSSVTDSAKDSASTAPQPFSMRGVR